MKIFILIHFILSTTFIIYIYAKNKLVSQLIAYYLISLTFPIGGLLLVSIFNSTKYRSSSLNNSIHDNLDYINDGNDNFKFVKNLNIGEETRIIPIEKALIEEDFSRRREAVLNLIKKNINSYTTLMNMALINEDGETSHYAAASILNSKRKLDKSINTSFILYNENPLDLSTKIAYSKKIMEFINNGYLDDNIKINYINENINLLKEMIDNNIDLDFDNISNLIDLLLINDDYKSAVYYTDMLMNDSNNSERKYIQILKSYYTIKDLEKFNLALRKFISSDIVFSKDTINIIRFWIGG